MKRENAGRIVRVYRNLRAGPPGKAPVYSVVDAKTGRVIFRAGRVALGEVEFIVRPAGRSRVLKTGRKNVHAFAVGILLGIDPDEKPARADLSRQALDSVTARCDVPVTYNPRVADTFRSPSGHAVRYSLIAILDARGVHVDWPDPAL